jgi:hypothetical protein
MRDDFLGKIDTRIKRSNQDFPDNCADTPTECSVRTAGSRISGGSKDA